MSALARLGEWLVEPAPASTFLDCGRTATPIQERAARPRPVVAVVGLAPGCGTTTLSRALAATLARRDHGGAAIVARARHEPGSMPATRRAARLAGRLGLAAQAMGRLCLTSQEFDPALAQLAPVVFETAGASEHAHLTILLAPGHADPPLAELAARAHVRPLTIVAEPADGERWEHRAFLLLPRSRIGSRLAAAGWEPRGALAGAVGRLADACEEAACV